MRKGEEQQDPSRNIVLKFCRRFLPLTDTYEGKSFFIRRQGRLLATPLFVVFSLWRPLIFSSPRTLFRPFWPLPATRLLSTPQTSSPSWPSFSVFCIGRDDEAVSLPELWTVGVLMFIGAKMLLPERFHVPTWAALVVVAGVLSLSVLASVLFPKKEEPNSEERQA